MKIINPFADNTFAGARAYVTSIDVPIYEDAKRRNKINEYKRHIERELKVLLLTKNIVVTGASAMISEFGYLLFKENPILLENKMVLPATGDHVIGKDWHLEVSNDGLVNNYSNKVVGKDASFINNMKDFFKDNIHVGVGWNLENNSGNFKQKFIDGLKNDGSVLQTNLKRLNAYQFNELADYFTNQQDFNRGIIEQATKLIRLDENELEIILHFQELMYNMSGASVVNCESTLPQENQILDYSIADIVGRKIILSEKDIFCKIFFELYFDSFLQEGAIPLSVLDYITFEDILKMRQEFHDSGFIDSYNTIIQEIVNSVNATNNDTFLNLNSLHGIRLAIEKKYKEIFEEARNKAMKKKIFDSIGQTSINLGLGLAPFLVVSSLSGNKEASPVSSIIDQSVQFSQSRSIIHERQRLAKLKETLIKSNFLQQLSSSVQHEIITFANDIHRIIESRLNTNFGYY